MTTDPAMKPSDQSVRWYDSGPDLIRTDLGAAVSIVRIGMAANALLAQLQAGKDVSARPESGNRNRDLVWVFLTSASLTEESIQLARDNMRALREYATHIGAPDDLLPRIG